MFWGLFTSTSCISTSILTKINTYNHGKLLFYLPLLSTFFSRRRSLQATLFCPATLFSVDLRRRFTPAGRSKLRRSLFRVLSRIFSPKVRATEFSTRDSLTILLDRNTMANLMRRSFVLVQLRVPRPKAKRKPLFLHVVLPRVSFAFHCSFIQPRVLTISFFTGTFLASGYHAARSLLYWIKIDPEVTRIRSFHRSGPAVL